MSKSPASKSLTQKDIFDQLHGSSHPSYVFTGLVKKSENSDEIMISRGTDELVWRSIPVNAIESVQFIRPIRAANETYSLANIFLKAPQTDEGRAFSAMADLHASAVAGPPVPTGECPDGQSWVWDQASGRWVCAAQ
jgi:hypothetical protein